MLVILSSINEEHQSYLKQHSHYTSKMPIEQYITVQCSTVQSYLKFILYTELILPYLSTPFLYISVDVEYSFFSNSSSND